MRLARLAAFAFAAMFANDAILTLMVVFEAHYNAVLAGVCDVAGWLTALVCSALAIEEIVKHGWRTRKALTIIAAISAANFAGTITGVAIAAGLR